EAMGLTASHGHLMANASASFVHLSDDRKVRATWIDGVEVFRA
ncbi:MAG: nagA, partial [Devosia sp.]|nr:nagA [Devosia sp.]